MRREIQIRGNMLHYVRIPEKPLEKFWTKITLCPQPQPLINVTQAAIIPRNELPIFRGLEVPGQFSYNSLYPFTGRMYGYTYSGIPVKDPMTYWDITTMQSDQSVAKLEFNGRRKANRWIVGVDNPEIIGEITSQISGK